MRRSLIDPDIRHLFALSPPGFRQPLAFQARVISCGGRFFDHRIGLSFALAAGSPQGGDADCHAWFEWIRTGSVVAQEHAAKVEPI